MKATNLYAPTLRESPAEAEVISHKLMLRAGLIRKAAGGVYSYLPLGWRTIRKIQQIIREEMDAAGGQEIAMPIIQPSELWKESGRWEVYGDEMMRMKDRHGREFCLGPTHEEMITALVRDEVRSYKQLPLMLYQMANKYRDEIRPRFGLMRSREFIMKDLYSFDRDEEGMNISYQKMYDAYAKIFTRCGLEFRPVEADNGAIGGGHSHEFTVLAQSGESSIAYCGGCDYAASDEKAELKVIVEAPEDALPLEKVETPDAHTIELVKDYLKEKYQKPGNVFLGVVHRLDRPVSGLVVFARTSKALSRLNRMFAEGEVHKTYWAIVKDAPSEAEGTLTHWLVRNEQQNKSYAYATEKPRSKKAILHYRVIGHSDRYSLLEVRLLTGRHHQIRCQLAAMGCPIRGDLKYGAPRSNPDGSISLLSRRVEFTHPVSGQAISVEAPLPADPLWLRVKN